MIMNLGLLSKSIDNIKIAVNHKNILKTSAVQFQDVVNIHTENLDIMSKVLKRGNCKFSFSFRISIDVGIVMMFIHYTCFNTYNICA